MHFVFRATQAEENSFLRGKLTEFEQAVEQLKQQVIHERYEREKCQEELSKLQDQQRTTAGLRGRLTLHGFSGSLQTKLNFSPENGAEQHGWACQFWPYNVVPGNFLVPFDNCKVWLHLRMVSYETGPTQCHKVPLMDLAKPCYLFRPLQIWVGVNSIYMISSYLRRLNKLGVCCLSNACAMRMQHKSAKEYTSHWREV